jgi:hypothetical protein
VARIKLHPDNAMRMYPRLRSGFLILVALIGSLAADVQSRDIQARLEEYLRDASSISNVEVKMIDIMWIKDSSELGGSDAEEKEFSRTFEYYYLLFEGKYRASCKLVSGTRTNLVKFSETAFDGTSYVACDADHGQMTKSRRYLLGERGELQNSPLIAPFMFLSRHSDDCLPCKLRFTDIVAADFAKGLILPKGQASNGLIHISVPGLPLGKQSTLWGIAVDERGDSFTPRSITRTIPGLGQEIVYKLLSYTNLGKYEFPTAIAWTASTYTPTSSPSVISTGMTTLVSIRIPEHVAGSSFQLDEGSAVIIWDSDQGKLTKSGPSSEACPAYLRLNGTDEHQPRTYAQPATTDRLPPRP